MQLRPKFIVFNFIKIDVEGAEKQVLDGAKILLESQKEIVVLFEASDLNAESFGYSVKDFLLDIMSSGFFVYQLNKFGNLINISENEFREHKFEIYKNKN